MSSSVINNADILKVLKNAKPCLLKSILKTADRGLVQALIECIYNVTQGRIPLKPKEKLKLTRHKKILRKLVKKGENWQKKRKLLVSQTGSGIIPLILSTVVGGLLSSIFKT